MVGSVAYLHQPSMHLICGDSGEKSGDMSDLHLPPLKRHLLQFSFIAMRLSFPIYSLQLKMG